MPSFTVETRTDVYNVYFVRGKMILTDSFCDHITSGYFGIARFMLRETVLSFQKWDCDGNLLYSYATKRRFFA